LLQSIQWGYMKKNLFMVVTAALALFAGACTDDQAVTKAAQGSAYPVIGSWLDTIALPKGDSVVNFIVGIDIRVPDSTFSIRLVENGIKSLYTQDGTWQTIGDTIFLAGDTGTLYDSASQSIVPLPSSSAKTTAHLDIWRADPNLWQVSMSNISSAIDALPLAPQFKSIARTIRLDLVLQEP